MKIFSRSALLLIIVLSLAGLNSDPAAQGENELELRLVRNFGYGGLGRIQGQFTLRVVDPPTGLDEVQFYLDQDRMASDSQPPFQVQFHTGDYDPGEHQLWARGILESGDQLESTRITRDFLSSEQAWSETQGILVPLLLGVGALTLLGLGIPMLLSRKKEFTVGSYGPGGGAVCPRCELPFSRSMMAPNLLVGKLVRCPHCGKISLLARASPARLEEAERKYRENESISPTPSGDDELRKLLEESRYQD